MKFSIRRFNEWLIVIMLVVLVPASFYYIRAELSFLSDDLHYIFNMQPSTVILGHNTMNAIDIFGGDATTDYSMTWRSVSMYLNVVLYLMLGPFLLLKGYKRANKNEERAKPWYWYVGMMICIGSLSIIPTQIIKHQVWKNTNESAAESRTKDKMRAELAEVGFKTAQYEILEDGVDESFSIDELNMEDLKYEYAVESMQSDTLVTLMVTNPELPGYNVKMDVKPYSRSVLKQRN